MRAFVVFSLLCNVSPVFADDFDAYCAKSIKGSYSKKKKKNICSCAEDNLRSQLSADERTWLVKSVVKNKGVDDGKVAQVPTEISQRRIRDVEFQVFKNCSMNYKWKANADDIGVPDDITTP